MSPAIYLILILSRASDHSRKWRRPEVHHVLAERISGQAVAGDDAGAIAWFRSDQVPTVSSAPICCDTMADMVFIRVVVSPDSNDA
ncbi:hypothetical protein NXT3_PB00061 (plasmid) [Sinorhizobium fredii]|uniref:Uncharacterized protein n=1 Tax=Rhizobium fredii TaxID=380 RepID=A0A2L0HB68_RHIFR|nr:hypothetical protein NXT3_PB00061 [Sinorhizobium fredii]